MRLRAIQANRESSGNFRKLLPAWADEVGLSVRRVRTLFKTQTGMTFVAFLRDLRMRRAQKLLARTPKSVKEISFQLGYGSIVSFCRDFKFVNHCTPTEYRDHFRKR